jgi:TPR repeat protein
MRQQGKEYETEQWLRKAAAAGNLQAMSYLEALLSKQGRRGEAKEWKRRQPRKWWQPTHVEGSGQWKWEKLSYYREGKKEWNW